MAYSLIDSTSAGAGVGANNVTTTAIDTSGADLLVVVASASTLSISISDSASNVWLSDAEETASLPDVRIWYVASGLSTSATHTFTISSSGLAPSVAAFAFSGATANPSFSATNNTAASNTEVQPGAISSVDGYLMVAGWTTAASPSGNFFIIAGGWTYESVESVASQHWGLGAGWVVANGTSINPVLEAANAGNMSAAMQMFEVAPESNPSVFRTPLFNHNRRHR